MRKDLAVGGVLVVVSFAVAGLELAKSARARAAFAGRCSAQPPPRSCPHASPAVAAVVFVVLAVTMITSMWVVSGRPRRLRRPIRRPQGSADHPLRSGPAPAVRPSAWRSGPAPELGDDNRISSARRVDVISEATERVAARGRSRLGRAKLRTPRADERHPDASSPAGNVLTAVETRRTRLRAATRVFRP